MDNKEILNFLKDNQELFQDKPENLDWAKIYDLASARFEYDLGKFTKFWLNRGIYPENYLKELPKNFCRKSTIEEFTIPNNITSIGDSAFYYCYSLTSIVIPDSVTSIGNSAFHRCSRLTSITIGNSVISIGEDAFSECWSLTNVDIPIGVMSIGDEAFEDCGDNLIINYSGTKEDWKKIYNLSAFKNTYFTVNCTDGKIVKKKRT